MGLTSRKARPLNRTIAHLRDTRLVIIAAEGRKTEKQYFRLFRDHRVQVIVIPSDDNRSAPEYILERLNQFARTYQIGQDDELWLMIDTDRWGDRKLSEICREAVKKDYWLAISNPCFEVWLYLHLGDIDEAITTCQGFKQLLRDTLGAYNSSRLDLAKFENKIALAIERAKQLSPDKDRRWPQSIGTHVYKVVEQIQR